MRPCPRLSRALALVGALTACAPGGSETAIPGDEAASPAPPQRSPRPPSASPAEAEARAPIDADRGIAYGSAGIWLIAAWRAAAAPLGVVLVLHPEATPSAAIARVAGPLLDADWNHAYVEPSPAPLAARVAVAADLATLKALGRRQWLERGETPEPTITALLIDDRGGGEALALVQGEPPFAVQAAVILSDAGAAPRPPATIASGPATPLWVLEVPIPPGPIDAAAWSAILGFLDDVARARLGPAAVAARRGDPAP